MRKQKLVTLVAVLVFAGVSVAVLLTELRSRDHTFDYASQSAGSRTDTKTPLEYSYMTPRLAEAIAPAIVRTETNPVEVDGMPEKVVRVRADQVLAIVNGVSITLKDLIPVNETGSDAEQTMSPDMYHFLLNRAIDRELTFQAARLRGVELTEEQQQQLAERRALLQHRDSDLVRQVTMSREMIEFDIRDATGLMLQANLAARAGLPFPHVTPAQVERYYQNHIDQYGELPADPVERQTSWEKIEREIRQKLALEVQAEYQRALREMLDELRKVGCVVTNALPFENRRLAHFNESGIVE